MHKFIFCVGGIVALTAIIVGLGSCGPSLRRTAQSDLAFTRCFDMDYNPSVSLTEKEICWSAWAQGKVYNQPDDKMDYARLRLEELGQGISIPGPPGPPGDFAARPVLPPIVDSPQDLPRDAGELGTDAGLVDGGTVPFAVDSSGCEAMCKASFQACAGACQEVPGGAQGCDAACQQGYKTCMKHCFQ